MGQHLPEWEPPPPIEPYGGDAQPGYSAPHGSHGMGPLEPYAQPSQPSPYGQPSQPSPYGQPPQLPPYGQPVSPYGQPPSPYGQAVPPYYPAPFDQRQQAYQNGLYAAQKSRLAAGLLALFLGCFGIHNFYLGRVGIGVLQLLLTVLSLFFLAPLVAIWVLIEAILILSRSPSFATDAKGIPLRD